MRTQIMATKLALGLVLVASTVAVPALAQSAGTLTIGVGAGWVIPKNDNGNLTAGRVHVGNDLKPTLTAEYFVLDNLGIELLGAIPFTQQLTLNGQHIGDVQHLPPALYLQYHFTGLLGLVSPSLRGISPFVGVGVEHSFIYEAHLDASLAPHELHTSGSTGYTFHAGVDYAVDARDAIRFDVRYIDINSDIKLDGTPLGTAHIDPKVWGVAWIWKF